MSDQLVQIVRRTGRIDRVPRGDTPVIETHLGDGQTVVAVDLTEIDRYHTERKTVDWVWTAYVITTLGQSDEVRHLGARIERLRDQLAEIGAYAEERSDSSRPAVDWRTGLSTISGTASQALVRDSRAS